MVLPAPFIILFAKLDKKILVEQKGQQMKLNVLSQLGACMSVILKRIMLKKLSFWFLILLAMGCAVGVISRNAVVYVLCFMIVVVVILCILLALATNLIWRLLPQDFRKRSKGGRGRFKTIIFLSVLLGYIFAGIISVVCLPNASGLISLVSNATVFIFMMFFAWSLIRRSKPGGIVAGGVVFILFIGVLSFVSSVRLGSQSNDEGNPTRELGTLGYTTWIPVDKEDINKTGVTVYEGESAYNGLNFYCSQTSLEAYLMDMRGNVLHKWAEKKEDYDVSDLHGELCENGDLLVAFDPWFIRLDWDSKVQWKKRMRAHHDVAIDENKNLYVPVREHKVVFWHGIPVPIVRDEIVFFSPEGEIKKRTCLFELVENHVPFGKVVEVYGGLLELLKPGNMLVLCKNVVSGSGFGTFGILKTGCFDILHTNSIEIMDRNIKGFCRKGDWLISMRELDLIGIVDAQTEKLSWSWGPGQLDRQHQPTLLQNGNILIFDNGQRRGYSRVVELDPLTKKIAWEYRSEVEGDFFSYEKGGSQRLANGNTLITESVKGRAFEITRDGKVVWEFYNPNIKKESKERASIYRMTRIIDPKIKKLIKKPVTGRSN